MRFRALGGIALLLMLAGCVETTGPLPPVGAVPPGAEDTCGMAAAQGLIGLDRGTLGVLQRSGPLRVIGPDQAVTMDYSAERLNVFTDAQGRIVRLSCG